jgi:hypothetical protein
LDEVGTVVEKLKMAGAAVANRWPRRVKPPVDLNKQFKMEPRRRAAHYDALRSAVPYSPKRRAS